MFLFSPVEQFSHYDSLCVSCQLLKISAVVRPAFFHIMGFEGTSEAPHITIKKEKTLTVMSRSSNHDIFTSYSQQPQTLL